MKVIILAAGQGTRLRPLTDDRPKTMIELGGVPLLIRQMNILKRHNIDQVYVIAGYKHEMLPDKTFIKLINSQFASTNMLASLKISESLFDGTSDILITYGDIIYDDSVLNRILNTKNEFTIIVDKSWESLWSKRMENPISDAESLKIDLMDNVIEVGKKPKTMEEIQGQYIGIIKISKNIAPVFFSVFNQMLSECQDEESKMRVNNMYMTDYLQLLINKGFKLKATLIFNGWLELDSVRDYVVYNQLINDGLISQIIKLEDSNENEVDE